MEISVLGLTGQHRRIAADHLTRAHGLPEQPQQVDLGSKGPIHGRLPLQSRQAFLDGLQVGKGQLGLEGLDVPKRALSLPDADDTVGIECPNHMTYRIDVSDVCQELVPEALPLAGAFHQAGDVDEGHGGRDHPLRVEDRSQLVESRVGNRDHARVGIDGRERVIGREDPGIGEGVEQRGFAHVGKTDDADGQTHDPAQVRKRDLATS